MRLNFLTIGLVTCFIGGVMISPSVLMKQKTTHDAITIVGLVKAGESNSTNYHTHIVGKSMLFGNLSVEGGGIYFHMDGYGVSTTGAAVNTAYVEDFVSFSFQANDRYLFTFNNTGSDADKNIVFILKEEVIEPSHLYMAFIGFFAILPLGAIIAIIGLVLKLTGKRKRPKISGEIVL